MQKQAAMLQGIVLEENDAKQTDLTFDQVRPKLEMEAGAGVEIQDGAIIVREENAVVTCRFQGVENSETYLSLEGAKARKLTMEEYYQERWDGFSQLEKSKIYIKESGMNPDLTPYTIQAKGVKSMPIFLYTPRDSHYTGKENYLYNAGYHKEALQEMELIFSKKGVYTYKDFAVLCQPMTNVPAQTEKLGEEVMENVVIDQNYVTGDIALSKDKIICFSIPYSKGWKLLVDGKEQELKQANTMFMAAELQKGNHQIRLVYRTPYLKEGVVLSGLGILLLLGVWMYHRKIDRRKQRVLY
jgi:uncharacterized membrane protein YfhO